MKTPRAIATDRRRTRQRVTWRTLALLPVLVGKLCGQGAGTEGGERGIAAAFDSRLVHVSLASAADAVEVAWQFANHWDFPLLIEKFDESCACLRGRADDAAVEPGESGVIRAMFTAGNRRGLVRKSLHVRFVGFEQSVELVAQAEVPSAVEVSRRELIWQRDQPAHAQSIELVAGTADDFHITRLAGLSPEEFEVHEKALEPGRHYRLSIRPLRPAVAAVRSLQVRTDSSDPRDRIMAIFLITGAESGAMRSVGAGSVP